MNRDMKNDSKKGGDLYLSVQGLRGKQSVRATFRLSEKNIRLLGLVASQLGIKQKSLFDQLVEDRKVLAKMAETPKDEFPLSENRRPKTYVMSRRSLENLDVVAKRWGVPRDLLVELSIQRLQPVIEAEQRKYRQRRNIVCKLESILERLNEMKDQAVRELGSKDEVSLALEKLGKDVQQSFSSLMKIVEKGASLVEGELNRGKRTSD